jgi:uncharacterized membrane protein
LGDPIRTGRSQNDQKFFAAFFKKEGLTSFLLLSRIFAGHSRLFASVALGLASLALLPPHWSNQSRGIAAWDIGAGIYLALIFWLFLATPLHRMEARAQAQQDGEWTLFWLVLAGTIASFAAILGEFGSMKGADPHTRDLKVGLVAATLILSWVVSQAVFALRYAHEFYSRPDAAAAIDGGLQFPGEDRPDYLDFFYFSAVLGMTFQVSDVQITSRKLRRLATLHGLLGFLFNTVIIALTVNLASGLLS